MSHLLRRVVLFLFVTALAAGTAVDGAVADEISSGDLYGVFANQGTFAGSDNYTVIHMTSFGNSFFPAPLNVDDSPAEDEEPGALDPNSPNGADPYLELGSEFFLVGNLHGVVPGTDHFLISAGGLGSTTTFAGARHSQLVDGVSRIGTALGTDPLDHTMDASSFWDAFSGTTGTDADTFQSFFLGLGLDIGRGPVGELHETQYSFSGSEDLFGYSAGGQLVIRVRGPIEDPTLSVPEPGTFALLLGGLAAGGALRRRRRRAA